MSDQRRRWGSMPLLSPIRPLPVSIPKPTMLRVLIISCAGIRSAMRDMPMLEE